MNIFAGNLSFKAKEADLKILFEAFGTVDSVRVVTEKKGKKSRGFGFVQMSDEAQAAAAIDSLNGREFMERPLNVSPARPKAEVERDKGEAKKRDREIKPRERENAWYKPALDKTFNKKRGRYKTGRRSLSFLKRQAAAGKEQEAQVTAPKPGPWRRKSKPPRPRQSPAESRGKPGVHAR